jgi:hypothetical protein
MDSKMKHVFLYSAFHWSMHLLFIALPLYIFHFDFVTISVALVFGILIDLDHLLLAPLSKWRMHMDANVARKVPLHNFFVLAMTFILSFTIIFNKLIGAVFAGIFLHLLWDLIEGIFIFKKGISHWKI